MCEYKVFIHCSDETKCAEERRNSFAITPQSAAIYKCVVEAITTQRHNYICMCTYKSRWQLKTCTQIRLTPYATYA